VTNEHSSPPEGTPPYYQAYDDRYRSVYAQGCRYWTSAPPELADTTAKLQQFLDRWGLRPGRHGLIEFGCGEGHLARYLLERGYRYCGVDLSSAGLAKARERVADLAPPGESFVLGDITSLPALADGAFDAALDNFCLHMLVADGDRRRYLREVRRLLAPGGLAYFHENHTDRPLPGPVATFEDFVAQTGFAPSVVDDRTVWTEAGPRTIRLTRVPFRALDEAGHRRELAAAGLEMRHFARDESSLCVIHARRSG
jgi:SAM-dependent methyltransferase